MARLKTIIVDDEGHGRSNLLILVNQTCPDLEVVALASSALEAQHLVETIQPDAMFLDIHMPEYDGFDLLGWFENRQFAVVFVTAFPDYGIQAIRAGAVDYLLKPIIIAELKEAANRMVEWCANKAAQPVTPVKDKIILSHLNGFVLTDLKDIIRFEAQSNYSKVYLVDKPAVLVSKTLKEFEMSLADSSFVRIHKSDIINIVHIKQYSFEGGGLVTMNDGTRLYVSRPRQASFISAIKKYSISLS